jgi:hypothetical protein
MWFNIFNPFAWFSAFNPPTQTEVVAPIDEEDLPEDFDLEIDENFEETAE